MTLEAEVTTLIKQTESYEDALNYVDDIVEDSGYTRDEVIKELKKQMGRE